MKSSRIATGKFICDTPKDTFKLGENIGASLKGGEVILLTGTLGAGKTLLAKGIVNSLHFDIDEVTSPSFTFVNLYKAEKNVVYHIDLWRIGESRAATFAVGLDEILENEDAIFIIEWAERLKNFKFPRELIQIEIKGDGDDPRLFVIKA